MNSIQHVQAQLERICETAVEFESAYAADIAAVDPEFRTGARNLVHYLALRHADLRDLQQDLARLGLSSLGRAERSVLSSIHAVQSALARMSGADMDGPATPCEALQLINPDARRHKNTIFGEVSEEREACIMVTLPYEAGHNYALVAGMIDAGMNVARINTGHDDKQVWAGMIENVRSASRNAGKACRIFIDLSGPKIRTGDLQPGPRVLHVRPRRNSVGRVIAPRRVRFITDDALWPGRKSQVVRVPSECIDLSQVGDELRFKDARGKRRKFEVVKKDDRGLVVETCQGAYLVSGAKLRLHRKQTGEKLTYRFGDLPMIEQPILLRVGDTLILRGDDTPGVPAVENAEGNVVEPAHIACQQPEIFEFVAEGDPIWLNDGKIGGIVRSVHPARLQVEITRAKENGSKLRGHRGINFPDSHIRLPSLTAVDIANLEFVTQNADAVCLSFVREAADIVLLQQALQKFPDKQLGLVIKIETERAFKKLPELLLTAMRSYPVAIMIARGDLAVECGWVRLAELQEEILWLCEAAELPVIWATEVLEHEAKSGQPSRAEITDAAMSQRADCVMLNKGAHILATIRMLDDILRRMQGHHYKKTALLRKLRISSASAEA